jgi:hypothetical protein
MAPTKVLDGEAEVLDLVGGLRCIDDLNEDDGVNGDNGVVLRDDVLARHVEHGFHHRETAADAIDERHEKRDAGLQRARVAAEALGGVLAALRHDLDGAERQHECGDRENKNRRHFPALQPLLRRFMPC